MVTTAVHIPKATLSLLRRVAVARADKHGGRPSVSGVLVDLAERARIELGGPVAAEPKVHFRQILLHKGLDPEGGVVSEIRTNPNGTDKAFHASVPIGSTSTGAVTA